MPTVPDEPMLAAAVSRLPEGGAVAFEPKVDGFRALLLRSAGGRVRLLSRRGTALTSAFPDIAVAAERDLPADVLLDGELVVWKEGKLAFDELQRRLRSTPAAVARLAEQVPAHFVMFDVLHRGETSLMRLPYRDRRAALERLFADYHLQPPWTLCPMTTSRTEAEEWMHSWAPLGFEGLMIKELGQRYLPGVRGWRKYRLRHTTEALVGAVTGHLDKPTSLLLGRIDAEGRLRYTGRTTALTARHSAQIAPLLTPAADDHPWHGRTFTASWGSREVLSVVLVQPNLVVEVSADVAVDPPGRWRHPVRFQRLRADMAIDDVPRFGEGGDR